MAPSIDKSKKIFKARSASLSRPSSKMQNTILNLDAFRVGHIGEKLTQLNRRHRQYHQERGDGCWSLYIYLRIYSESMYK